MSGSRLRPDSFKPNLVFVHGIDGNEREATAQVIGILGGAYNLIAYDLLGRGALLGARSSSSHTIDEYVDQLRLLVTHRVSGPFHLMGFSMGGAIAAAFAARHPRGIMRVALVSPAGRISYLPKASTAIPFPVWKLIFPPIMISVILSSYEGHSVNQAYVRAKKETYRDERFQRVLYETFARFPMSGLDVSKLDIPTLVISGSSDAAVPVQAARYLARDLGAKFVVIEGGDHSLLVLKPREVGQAIREHFESRLS